MTAAIRPRRSVLYMPGSNPRVLEKAKGLAADALVFDLEDAVAPDAKAAARAGVLATIAAGGYGARELVIRSNGLNTPWGHADLVAAAASGAHAVLLPKVEDAGTVRAAAGILDAAGAPPGLAIWCMMETPRGMLKAAEIAEAHPRLGGFVMGTNDLAKDLNARHTRERLPLITALGLCLLAARANGLAILDGVFPDVADEEGFAFACRQGAELGFDGKTVIHPKQIGPANAAFGPDAAEVAWARKVIAAFAEAAAAGKGVLLVDGKLIEALHVETARRTVALADAIAALETARPAGA
ncbi:MAG: CoA ester lyase [Alphaproteobacteria bacterium]|nr:CoA ester lyase [Alphaproteobacteria bacterium]